MKTDRKRRHQPLLYICLAAAAAGVILTVLLFLLARAVFSPGEDLNGPKDSSVTTIAMEAVLKTENSYSAVALLSAGSGERTNVQGTLRTCDADQRTMKCHRLSGIMTIHATHLETNNLTLVIDTTLTWGNLQVFVLVDGEVAAEAEVNKTGPIFLTDVAGKDVVVRVAAEGAQVAVSVKRYY